MDLSYFPPSRTSCFNSPYSFASSNSSNPPIIVSPSSVTRTTPGNFLPFPCHRQTFLAFSSVAKSTNSYPILFAFNNVSIRNCAVFAWYKYTCLFFGGGRYRRGSGGEGCVEVDSWTVDGVGGFDYSR